MIQHAFDALSQGAMGLQGHIMSKCPTTTPTMLTIAFQALKKPKGDSYSEVVQIPWGVFFRDGLDLCRAYDMEFDFPLDIDSPDVVILAIKKLKELAKDYADGGTSITSYLQLYNYNNTQQQLSCRYTTSVVI